MRLPIAESMESRIFTRTGACIIKCGGLAVSAYEREISKIKPKECPLIKFKGYSFSSLLTKSTSYAVTEGLVSVTFGSRFIYHLYWFLT